MRFGVVVANQRATAARVAGELAAAEGLGFASGWMPGIPNGPDVLTLLAATAPATSHLELGPCVVAAPLRHPAALAAQALTVNDILGGRLSLGIGMSHRRVMADLLGVGYDSPARFMREYLEILVPLLRDQQVAFAGERLRATYRLEASSTDVPRPSVVLAALGPKMLEVAGALADGVATWMVGPRTLGDLTVPAARAAAERVGRPGPRVLASLPFLLTNDLEAAEARAGDEFAVYGRLPVYQSMLEREGATSPVEIAQFGDEPVLEKAVGRLRDAGVTDLQITTFGEADERARTVEFLATLQRDG
jgi:F420-dependent oxidoreductase-like protein